MATPDEVTGDVRGGPCPTCGRPRSSVNNRCYHCSPGGGRPKGAVTAEGFGRDLKAVRVVYEAVAKLPPESAAWVLQAVGHHLTLREPKPRGAGDP